MNKIRFGLSVSSIVLGSIIHADDIIQKQWHAVVSLGGGTSSVTNLGSYQKFPIINPITDEYYMYSPHSKTQTKGLFEAFIGSEHLVFSHWLLQGGIAYSQMGSYKIYGTLAQGADALSTDQYTYKYKILTRQLLVQAKLMWPWHDKFYPYFLLGLGSSFNTVSNFSTNVPPFLTFTREYQNNQSHSFTYKIALGIDADIAKHTRLGVAYRFADAGRASLGSASIDNIPVPGTLYQSNLYTNEAFVQLTYIF